MLSRMTSPLKRGWVSLRSTHPTEPSLSSEQRLVAVEDAQDLVGALVGDLEHRAIDAGLLVFAQRPCCRRGAEHRGGERLGVAPLLLGHPVQPRELFLDLIPAAGAREPAIAILDDAAQRVISLATEDDRRVWFLQRLRPRPHLVEIHRLAVIFGFLLGPQRLHREDTLAHQLEARVVAGAVVLHLLDIPAAADPEDEAAARQLIEAGDAFRRDDRIALGNECDAGAEHQLSGRRCGEGQRDERIMRMGVALRQFAAARERRLAADRDMGVLGDEQRFKAAVLQRARQLDDVDAVICRKVKNPDLHVLLSKKSRRGQLQPAPLAAGARNGATPALSRGDNASSITCAAGPESPALAGTVCNVSAPEAKLMPFSVNTR